MKNTVISIFLVILAVIGWVSWMSGTAEEKNVADESKSMVKTADGYMERGLYQRAMEKYNAALSINETEDVREKLINAYALRYEEDEGIFSSYVSQLENAVNKYPKNLDFCTELVKMYDSMGAYEKIYTTLNYVLSNGLKNEELEAMRTAVRYDGNVTGYQYEEIECLSNGTYVVQNEGYWGAVSTSGSNALECAYEYVSPASSDGTRVYTTAKDSRLINGNGMVLGIFEEKVFEAGIFANDMIPVRRGDEYVYVDSFADEVMGGYEYAGSFSNNMAAVKKEDKWYFINNKGEEIGGAYYDIVVDGNGNYLSGSFILAAKEEGTYGIYDKELKKIADFDCDAVDICTVDGIIAFKDGDLWGYVNTEGKVVIKPEFDEAKSFSNGLAAVCKDGKWGFIDPNGAVVIEYTYEAADYFNAEGKCWVSTYIDNGDEPTDGFDIIINDNIEDYIKKDEASDEDTLDKNESIWVMFKLNIGIRKD